MECVFSFFRYFPENSIVSCKAAFRSAFVCALLPVVEKISLEIGPKGCVILIITRCDTVHLLPLRPTLIVNNAQNKPKAPTLVCVMSNKELLHESGINVVSKCKIHG